MDVFILLVTAMVAAAVNLIPWLEEREKERAQ